MLLRPLVLARIRSIRPTSPLQCRTRSLSTIPTPTSFPRRRLLPALLLLGLAPVCYTIHLDSAPSAVPDEPLDLPLAALIRTYAVYSMCSIPALVDNAPWLLDLATMPGVRWLAQAFVRATFFEQFVGGDTAQDTLPLLHKLRAANKGALLAYSVEVDEKEAMGARTHSSPTPHKRIVDEMRRCIDVAADFEDALQTKEGRKTWVAIKLSALLPDAHALARLSAHLLATRPAPYSSLAHASTSTPSPEDPIPFPGSAHPADLDVLSPTSLTPLTASHAFNHSTIPPIQTIVHANTLTPTDLAALSALYADLRHICAHARVRGVRVIIDAEYSWYQPAIDALVAGLMREFNRSPDGHGHGHIQPLVYGTYQAYLRRTPLQLARDLHDAREGGYALGVKLVRGAYHAYEVAAHGGAGTGSHSISPDVLPPVHATKPATDACYDVCARLVLEAVADDLGATSPGSPAASSSPARVGVLFGTHNWHSCDRVLGELVRLGLASTSSSSSSAGPHPHPRIEVPEPVAARVALAQLYGMCDDLTAHLVARTAGSGPLVLKYVPYGALAEVMPYLARRAVENRGVLGVEEEVGAGERRETGARGERRRAARELRRRVWGALGGSDA